MGSFIIGLLLFALLGAGAPAFQVWRERRRGDSRRRLLQARFSTEAAVYLRGLRLEANRYTMVGTDSATLELAEYYVTQSLEHLEGAGLVGRKELLSQGNWLVLGDAGEGKSTLASMLALELLESGGFPVLVRLGDLLAPAAREGPRDPEWIEVYLRRIHASRFGADLDLLAAAQGFANSLVILDGLDELPSELTAWVSAGIVRLAARNAPVRVLVTSRPMERSTDEWQGRFQTVRLLPFSEDQIYRFANTWLERRDRWVLERVGEMIRRSDRVRDLLRRPLFLQLALYVVGRYGDTDATPQMLIRGSVELMLDAGRYGSSAARSRMSSEETAEFLSQLARSLLEAAQMSASRDTVLALMSAFLRTERGYGVAEADTLAPTFLEDLLFKNSLVRLTREGYQFIHRAFRDFFAAETLRQESENALANRINDPDWAEVCLLLLEDTVDSAELLVRVYKPGSQGSRRVAATALAEMQSLEVTTNGIRSIALDVLEERGAHAQYFPIVRRLLGALDNDAIESVREEIKERFASRPEVLAVLREAEVSVEASQVEKRIDEVSPRVRRSVRLIGERQGPLLALQKLLFEQEWQNLWEVTLDLRDAIQVSVEVDRALSSESVDYDIVIQPHRRLGLLATAGLVLPINTFLADSKIGAGLFEDWWKEMSWYGGLCYGFPIVALNMYLWLRGDLLKGDRVRTEFERRFARAPDLPRRPGELRELIRLLTDSGRGVYGIVLQGGSQIEGKDGVTRPHPGLYHEWLNFLYAFGGRVLDQEFGWEYGAIVVNSEEAIRATEFYASLFDPELCHPASWTATWDDIPRIMESGEAAMCVMWTDAVHGVVKACPSFEFLFGLVPVQSGHRVSQSDGWSMFIPSKARNPRLSYEFMEWVLSDEVQRKVQLLGGASPVRSVYRDADVMKLPYMEASLEALERRVPRETVPESEALWRVITEELAGVIHRQGSVRAALNRAAERLEVEVFAGKTARRFRSNATGASATSS